MSYNVVPLDHLIEHFERLPGIGRKTAQRLAFYVLSQPEDYARGFSSALVNAVGKIHRCGVCCNLTDSAVCDICSDSARDHSTICVVEDSQDVLAFERTRKYNGMYHVLHGAISPLDGITPDKLCVKELMARLSDNAVNEVIIATNSTVEGESTSSYLSRIIKPLGIKVTRLAYGIPVGGDLEYADDVTLSRALEGRNEI